MTERPWNGDACSLVDAFRAGERSPVEELEATIAAIAASGLNAFAHLDLKAARAAAAVADVARPFGGVPFAIKELEPVAGWPYTEASLAGRWPACASEMTDELRVGVQLAENLYNMHMAAAGEMLRREANEAMARLFAEADFVITSTNPGPAFAAEAGMSSDARTFIDYARGSALAQRSFSGALKLVRAVSGVAPKTPQRLLDVGARRSPELLEMGALTMPANLSGNPAISIPVGDINGLPIGMQIIGRHHEDALLLDLALHVERERPWPLVAPLTPR